MKFIVPNYSCPQNPWLGGYRPQIPVLSVINWICWTPPPLPNKIPGYATETQRHLLGVKKNANCYCLKETQICLWQPSIKMSVTRNTLINSPFKYYRNNAPEDDSLNESKLVVPNNNKDKQTNVTTHFLHSYTWRLSQIKTYSTTAMTFYPWILQRRLKWAGHVACMEEINNKILVTGT